MKSGSMAGACFCTKDLLLQLPLARRYPIEGSCPSSWSDTGSGLAAGKVQPAREMYRFVDWC